MSCVSVCVSRGCIGVFARRVVVVLMVSVGSGAALQALAQASRIGVAPQTERLVLVSPEEVLQFKADFLETLVISLAGDEPLIDILQPKLVGGIVQSPVAIEVRFKAADGAH